MKQKVRFALILLFILMLLFYSKVNNDIFINLRINTNENYTQKIPVFAFHKLVPDEIKKKLYPNNLWVMGVDIFKQMMKYLYDNGYRTISGNEFYEQYIGKVDYVKKTVLITFDDGNYEDYYLAYPIIKKYNFKAISFVVGSKIKNKTESYYKYQRALIGLDIINKLRKDHNFEFQSHSYNMHFYIYNNITKKRYHGIRSMSYEQLKNDTLQNKKFGFKFMAYPFGEFKPEMKDILKNQGYLLAFTFSTDDYARRTSNRFTIPRINLNGNSNLSILKKWLNY